MAEIAPVLDECAASLTIPSGTRAVRVQPTMSDADWRAGQNIFVTAHIDGSAAGATLNTGFPDEGKPGNGDPAFVLLVMQGDHSTIDVTVSCAGIEIGAVVEFAPDEASMPAAIGVPTR